MNDGTVIRDGHESQVRPGQELFTTVQTAKSASPGSRPGILVFSRGRRLLHMNSRALELTGHLNQAEIGPAHNIRSTPVCELIAQIQETLDHRREADIWEIFELKRVIFEPERKILVRGFGLADRNSHDDSRIVIVLEEVGHRQEHKPQPTPGNGSARYTKRNREIEGDASGGGPITFLSRTIRETKQSRVARNQ